MSVTPTLLCDMVGKERLGTSWSIANSLAAFLQPFSVPIGGNFVDFFSIFFPNRNRIKTKAYEHLFFHLQFNYISMKKKNSKYKKRWYH